MTKRQDLKAFPDADVVSALRRQLGWTHFKPLITLKDEPKRTCYAVLCRVERWTPRALPHEVLEARLHQAVSTARERLAATPAGDVKEDR